jgi:hypothetical protein
MYFRKEWSPRQTYNMLASGLLEPVIYFDFEMILSGMYEW